MFCLLFEFSQVELSQEDAFPCFVILATKRVHTSLMNSELHFFGETLSASPWFKVEQKRKSDCYLILYSNIFAVETGRQGGLPVEM